jgi:group I intron endonuclease
MQKHYVYLTTNLINGKQYVGDHTININKRDSYLGSGALIKEDQKIYGKDNFSKKILEYFNSKEEAYQAQRKYIKQFNTHISQGGYNKNWTGGQWATIQSEETKRKISIAGKGKKSPRKGKKLPIEHTKNISLGLLGEKNPNHKSKLTEERRLNLIKNLRHSQVGKNNGMYGKKHKPESIEKNRNTHKKENLSFETISKMSISAKNRPKLHCEHCNKEINSSMYARWHGSNCKLIKNIC